MSRYAWCFIGGFFLADRFGFVVGAAIGVGIEIGCGVIQHFYGKWRSERG